MLNMPKNTRGVIGTVIFHIILIIILYTLGFSTPLPLPAEEGILINFGDEDFGVGNNDPELVEKETKSFEKESHTEMNNSDEGYNTQDFEEAPEVIEGKKDNSEIDKQKKLEELERKRKEEIARQKKLQEENIKKQKEIDNMVTNAFSKGQNTESNSNSEGITNNKGNQGNINGSINSDDYTDINSSGNGGVSFSLDGRNPLKLPPPDYNYQVEGKVVVEVTVDQNGKVTKAVPGVKGSTTLDENLLKAAKDAALKTIFDLKLDAPAYQKGSITYYFKLK